MTYLKSCFVCLAAGLIAASAMGQIGSRSATNQPTSTGPISMQGCINGGPHGYTFIQTSTGTAFALPDANGRFAQYRGKLVNLTGTETPPTTVSGANDMPQLRPVNVKQIGDCPLNTAGKNDRPHGAPLTSPPMTPPDNAAQHANVPGAATPEYASPGAPNQRPPTAGNNPNQAGASGAPSPGTGNPPPQPTPPVR